MTTVTPRRPHRWLRWLAIPPALLFAYLLFVAVRLFLFLPELKIGRETTFVNGPLRADGTVDFAAAINKEWSQGITPENNAAVLLMQAFGAEIIAPEIREQYFAKLQMNPPQAEGVFLLPLGEFCKQEWIDPARQSELEEVVQQAGSEEIGDRYPELALWVQRNEVQLDLVTKASRREHFFAPLIPPPATGLVLQAELEILTWCREATRLLATRAFLRLASGDTVAACQDAMTIHRLGRLVSRHQSCVGFLIGISIDTYGSHVSEAIILSERLDAKQASRFRAEIVDLPPVADVAVTVDRMERLSLLSAVQYMMGSPSDRTLANRTSFRKWHFVDPNVVLRTFNEWTDKYVETMRVEDYANRTRRVTEAGIALSALSQKPTTARIASAVATADLTALSRTRAETLVTLIFPAAQLAQRAEDRANTRGTLTRLGWALAEYRAVHGEFPEVLDALRPEFAEELPLDLYSGKPLLYQRVEDGFILYAVGPNGFDDGGADSGTGITGECDDIRFGVAPVAADAPSGRG